ncbi:hypothetical protein AAG570_009655 [Ranatra chinensis]|uniref:Uncharacterized protein n=1 Tax=Ranatra chinensis TaxID=642074 RepID=A0ABD0YPP8_9HEMI
MASKVRNMHYQNKKQETTEIGIHRRQRGGLYCGSRGLLGEVGEYRRRRLCHQKAAGRCPASVSGSVPLSDHRGRFGSQCAVERHYVGGWRLGLPEEHDRIISNHTYHAPPSARRIYTVRHVGRISPFVINHKRQGITPRSNTQLE